MSDIFLSYSRHDRPQAEMMASALADRGWSVWWDWKIPAGKAFRSFIDEHLQKARLVIVLWSTTSVTSEWVIEEATEGKVRGILVPTLIEEVQPPLGFRSLQTTDLTAWTGETDARAFVKLCFDIEALIGVPLASAGTATSQMPPRPEPQTNPKNSARYVWVPPGEFWMGAVPGDSIAFDCEKPRHRVRITKGFWLGETPVTVEAYKQFVSERPEFKMPFTASDESYFNRDRARNNPIVWVTWAQAKAYSEWAGGRLPTSAEWEYAVRAGKNGLKYPWGNEITRANANSASCKWKDGAWPVWKDQVSPVRSYPANDWGLYDMAGNVWEWVSDWYRRDYYTTLPAEEPAMDPQGPSNPESNVLPARELRGGSFDSDDKRDLRISYRTYTTRNFPESSGFDVGFRCIWEAPSPW